MILNEREIKRSKIYPVLALEAVVSPRNLERAAHFLEALFLVFVILTLAESSLIGTFGLEAAVSVTRGLEHKLLGALTAIFSLLSIIFLLRAYLRSSYYFENIINNRYSAKDLYTFTVGRILYRAKNDDYLIAFLRSNVGRQIMTRLGIGESDISRLVMERGEKREPIETEEEILKLRSLVRFLYERNGDFEKLLAGAGVGLDGLLAVTDWVVRGIEAEEMATRWWRPENLNRIGSLGSNWSYGYTPALDRYSSELLDRPEAQFSAYEIKFREKEVRQIESVLARAEGSNVLLVGESEPLRFDVLWALVREVKRGTILPELEHKRVLLFDNALFLADFKDRAAFEQGVANLFKEAVAAGDVVLIISDFASFLAGAETLGSQIFGLLDPYLESSRLSVVAMADTDKYRRLLEPRSEIMARFERVLIAELSEQEAVSSLLSAVDGLERKYGVCFSYQALRQVVANAESYLGDGELSDKAKDLVVEIVPWALQNGITLLLPAHISAYVTQKTNIPTGIISEKEKEILLNLKQLLQARVIGQQAAIEAVAGAMKRARAGVVNAKRPLGSFLFLGPTGVGKTETAKALAAAYFGSDDKLLRLDMTEYQEEDALTRLIGSFADGKPGVLASLLRENGFGVLLLDEFEKTSRPVRDLFLQILDEGSFSDMNGKKVNARNLIIIATSNAGAELIWEMVKKGEDPAAARDTIIDRIVQAGTFKPELLNRFDDIVIFHPLGPSDLRQVARLMLAKLAKRLEPKGIDLHVTDFLSSKVSTEGANEIFGARPMNRYIQDEIEQLIADKIIAGELKPGSIIEIAPEASGRLAILYK